MLYDHFCPVCSFEWEVEQRISDPPVVTCPKCLVCSAKRVITGGQGFLLKGTCWYKDGYSTSTTTPEEPGKKK